MLLIYVFVGNKIPEIKYRCQITCKLVRLTLEQSVKRHVKGVHMSQLPQLDAAQSPLSVGKAWTFLTNHGHVLIYISKHEDARVRDIASTIGITERTTQGILNDLESSGYIEKVREGRRNRYVIHPDMNFRHPQESTQKIVELIKLFH